MLHRTQSLDTVTEVLCADCTSQSVPATSYDFFTIEANCQLLMNNVTNGLTRYERCKMVSEVIVNSPHADIYDWDAKIY